MGDYIGKRSFNNFVNQLKNSGYEIKKDLKQESPWVIMESKEMIVLIGHPNMISEVKNKVIAENKKLFKDWEKTIFKCNVPTNIRQRDHIISRLNFWSTEEGLEMSKEAHRNGELK